MILGCVQPEVWKMQRFASQKPGQKGAQKCPTVGSLPAPPPSPGLPDIRAASSCFWMKRANMKSCSSSPVLSSLPRLGPGEGGSQLQAPQICHSHLPSEVHPEPADFTYVHLS